MGLGESLGVFVVVNAFGNKKRRRRVFRRRNPLERAG